LEPPQSTSSRPKPCGHLARRSGESLDSWSKCTKSLLRSWLLMAMGYSPLRVEDRCLIQAQLSLRWSPAAIAAGLGRSRSTIPREIARNGWAVGAGGNRVDSQLRRSMTYDQGTEMAHHKTLTEKTGVAVYFAHPHSPQQRGKHQRPAAAVPAQKHRPQRVDPGPARLHRLADQYQTTQNTRMQSSRRTLPPPRSLQLRDILGRIR